MVRRQWCLVLLLATAVHASAFARKLVLAATEYPPYYSESLDKGGPVAELTVTALRRAGYEVEVRFMPWARALKWGEQGKVDGLIGVWRSPERELAFVYSEPVVSNRIVLCRMPGRGPARFTSFAALRRYTVGTVRGYADPPGLAAAGIHTEPVTYDLQNLKKLVAGHIDLVLIDSRVGRYLIQRNLGREGEAIDCIQPPVQEHPQYLVVSRHTTDAASIVAGFNERLLEMRQSGEFDRIGTRWGW